MRRLISCFLATVLLAGGAFAQATVDLSFLCFQDGVECEVYADLLSRFSSENPAIAIEVEVVAEAEFGALLTARVAEGRPPDLARIPDFDDWAGRYLDLRPRLGEAAGLGASFPAPYFAALRGWQAGDGFYGYPDALRMVAPFVNMSLFEQAGVALPLDGASWDEWLAALDQVVAATGASYALAVDNKDHRLVGPALSLGAQYFGEDGRLTLPDANGLLEFLQILHGLMDDGKTPADTLLGTGASQDYFTRGETVMYICGSWKAEPVAMQVGDDFDWAIVPNPAGDQGGTGVAQAKGLVALAATEHPQAVAEVFEYLLQPALLREFSARTLTIPANGDLASTGIDYATDNDVIAAALNGFAREAAKLQDQAIALDLHPLASAYYEASNTNLRAYFAGDLTLEEALAGLRQALDEANAAAASP